MKSSALSSSMVILAASISIVLVSTVATAPLLESEDEELTENSLAERPEDGDGVDWDSVNVADLRKLLLQLDTENRMMRVSRSWPAGVGDRRGGGGGGGGGVWSRALGRQVRPWRADKRQVRFRQCYFNPISCFK